MMFLQFQNHLQSPPHSDRISLGLWIGWTLTINDDSWLCCLVIWRQSKKNSWFSKTKNIPMEGHIWNMVLCYFSIFFSDLGWNILKYCFFSRTVFKLKPLLISHQWSLSTHFLACVYFLSIWLDHCHRHICLPKKVDVPLRLHDLSYVSPNLWACQHPGLPHAVYWSTRSVVWGLAPHSAAYTR